MDQWLAKITEWIINLVKAVLKFIPDLIGDIFVKILDWILLPIGDLIASIPAPSFMSAGGGLSALLNGFPPFAQYMIYRCNIGEALVVIGAGVSFRLLRKLFTLGQW